MTAPADPAPSDPRVFACKVCGWVLGESYREPGKHVTHLRIFRHPYAAISPALHVPATPSRPATLYCAVQVNDCTVLCEHCGAQTGWFANQNAIEMMIERRNNRKDVINGKKEVPP